MKKIDWYDEFVDLDYKPSSDELIALFYFEPPQGMSFSESAGRIASESSTGTWTTLNRIPERMKTLQAMAFQMEGNLVKIAYPLDLWEEGNMPQLMSGIAGNIFGMKGVGNLRLIDVSLPLSYIKHFKGPLHGMDGIRDMFRIYDRPLTGAVPKPKIGFSAFEHAEVAYETWMGGFDLVKDDENLSSQTFNRFDKRVQQMTIYRNRAERETGEKKDGLINITAETDEMKRRADILHDSGWKYCMIDVVVAGFSAVQTIREHLQDLGMIIHAHRAMHAAFTRNPHHGISMHFLAKLMRLAGVNQIHTGTAVGKLVGSREEVKALADLLRSDHLDENVPLNLKQDWGHINSVFPVSSGGLHPGLVPEVLDIYGKDLVLLVSGGIHGHPKGTRAGAKASMQAIEAWKEDITLEEKAQTAVELSQALEKWGHHRPR